MGQRRSGARRRAGPVRAPRRRARREAGLALAGRRPGHRLSGTGLGPPAGPRASLNAPIAHGSLACLKACPEGDIPGIAGGAARLVHATRCIGHGRCAAECPVGAIRLVVGTAERGVDLPEVDGRFESSRPGVHVVGAAPAGLATALGLDLEERGWPSGRSARAQAALTPAQPFRALLRLSWTHDRNAAGVRADDELGLFASARVARWLELRGSSLGRTAVAGDGTGVVASIGAAGEF